jgi:hypothetical protein
MVNGQCRYDFLVLCYLESVSIRQLSVYLPLRNTQYTLQAGKELEFRVLPTCRERVSHSEEQEQIWVAPR